MDEQQIITYVEEIYTEVYGHLDDKRFCDAKYAEIEDWLREGDIDGTETTESLVAEWRDYDVEDIARNA